MPRQHEGYLKAFSNFRDQLLSNKQKKPRFETNNTDSDISFVRGSST